jgi:UDP-GlcNAc:undecaprenyl-phosphate GlcNAc-1-phosphate transferase
MSLVILLLVAASFAISWLATSAMIRLAPKIGFVDRPGHRKIHDNPKPLGGGVGIFLGLAIPIIAGLGYIAFASPPEFLRNATFLPPGITTKIDAYWSGARMQSTLAWEILIAGLLMHVLGLLDDKKALGPMFKLIVQLAITSALVLAANLRVLTFLDNAMPAGRAVSAILTILWIAAVTNAFNFLDNMDGLSSGVAAVCTTAFLVATLSIGQWFVAAGLALLLGSTLGFLWHNFPPAKIFMGDGGSLLLGFILGVLTVRTTYLSAGSRLANDWYSIFAPVIVLALPLYDLIVVSIIRLARGKSPFVGDTNHFSHRLVARGMSRRTAVLCIYLVTAATSIAAILLPHVPGNVAPLIFAQTILILGVVALLELTKNKLETQNENVHGPRHAGDESNSNVRNSKS